MFYKSQNDQQPSFYTKDKNCSVTFFSPYCVFQNLSMRKTILMAKGQRVVSTGPLTNIESHTPYVRLVK